MTCFKPCNCEKLSVVASDILVSPPLHLSVFCTVPRSRTSLPSARVTRRHKKMGSKSKIAEHSKISSSRNASRAERDFGRQQGFEIPFLPAVQGQRNTSSKKNPVLSHSWYPLCTIKRFIVFSMSKCATFQNNHASKKKEITLVWSKAVSTCVVEVGEPFELLLTHPRQGKLPRPTGLLALPDLCPSVAGESLAVLLRGDLAAELIVHAEGFAEAGVALLA